MVDGMTEGGGEKCVCGGGGGGGGGEGGLFHTALYFVNKKNNNKNDRISSPLEDDEENISKPRAFWHPTPKGPKRVGYYRRVSSADLNILRYIIADRRQKHNISGAGLGRTALALTKCANHR